MQENKHLRILISGAGGWIGKELLCLLQNTFGSLSSLDLTLSGSYTRNIEIHGENLRILSFDEIELLNQFDLVVHLAFITQEKMALLGEEEYIRANSQLSEYALKIKEFNPAAYHLVLSSGVTSLYDPNELTSKNIYARLKLDLEKKMADEKSLILRLWNTSGHHLGFNSNYALSEFIFSAKNNQPITIRNNVSRSYVAAQNVLCASLNYLLSGGEGIVNSGGFETDLENLAGKVIESLNSQSAVICSQRTPNSNENYVSPMSEIPRDYWLSNDNLEIQVRETSIGIDPTN